MKIKKISEFCYEIDGKAIVYADENIIKDIEKDKSLEQIKNVSELPGIIGKAIAMPDIHQGYGFPIGGVAIFDLKKGIISPGGVGYDINCLTGDSKILTEFGSSIKIEDFEKIRTEIEIEQNNLKIKKTLIGFNLPTMNIENKTQENKPVNLFMQKESNDVYEIELNSGLKIKATSDHPFLTKEGMKPISSLIKDDELAINLFSGIECAEEIDEKTAITTKVLGYLFGDGCCYISKGKYYGVAYGTKEDLEKMQEDLLKINVSSKINSRTRDHKILTKYGLKEFNTTNHELHIYSKEFLQILEKLGMPQGNKTRQEVKVPEWIKKSNKLIKRLFLAGFFGAELSSPKTSSKTGFYSPTINQNKINSLSQNMREFLIDISLMLEEFEISTTKLSEMKDFHNKDNQETRRFRLLISAEEDNLLKLWRNVGFEYNKKRQKLANISLLYILLKKQENKKRQEIALKIKSYKEKGFKLKEVQKLFEKEINARFIERHYYENAKQRINLDFISFDDFSIKKLKELEEFGTIFDNIKEIKKIEGKYKVYDFNIQDNHNFMANNFIVSNCGVRILNTNISFEEFKKKIDLVSKEIKKEIPSGVGKGNLEKLDEKEIDKILTLGAKWAIEKGFGNKQDLERCEENGCVSNVSTKDVSPRAKARGKNQMGTLGSGNHFLEIQRVEEIFDEKTAKAFGLKTGNIVFMIHCGSRGLGHQVASDYIQLMEKEYGQNLKNRELINAPINSDLGKKYFSAMNGAINFAFCNRQIIMDKVRKILEKNFPKAKMNLLYDVCHNIAKIEEHVVNKKKTNVCIHRKGATRAFGPGRAEIPKVYREFGQPVIIPGSMGTSSYILVGTNKSEEISYGSTAHGAGRVMSRSSANKNLDLPKLEKEMKKKEILILTDNRKGLLEEAPEAYKDIEEVVNISDSLGIAKKVARLKPVMVVKG